MTRVYSVVEGPTEESFINTVLAPSLWARTVYLTPIIVGVPGHKGGRTNYARVKKDVLKLLQQHKTAYCTTMLDFYGLGKGFPGTPLPAGLTNIGKVQAIEQAFKRDIVEEIPDLRADARFLPYLQLHEYEALLFSDPVAFARGIYEDRLATAFQRIRDEFRTPEDINDRVDMAPSKRVAALCPQYSKPLYGSLAAVEVTLTKMRQECPHFDEWMRQLERLMAI